MLTFLRKIRKSLIDSGSTRRYLLYAVGEIALVVIGILIALQINNWNELMIEQKKEEIILNNLRENLEININLLNEAIKVGRLKEESVGFVIEAIENNLPFHDTLGSHFFRASWGTQTMTLSTADYESFKTNGYDIVKSEALKKSITNLFEMIYEKVLKNQDDLKNIQLQDGCIVHSRENFTYVEGVGLVPVNFEKIKVDHYYVEVTKRRGLMEASFIKSKQECLDRTAEVLQLIKDELR